MPRSHYTERRKWPRPPLWLNLLLLTLAALTFAFAKHQRDIVRTKTAQLFAPTPKSNADLDRVREQLADMDVNKAQLARELDAKLDYLKTVQGSEFYIAIDTQKKKLYLRIGPDVAREADVVIGEAKTINDRGRTWTFVPLKGGFSVLNKSSDYDWPVPEWTYAMNRQPIPEQRPSIPNGLGHYIVVLPDNYLIHSPPPVGSPLQGMAKPGSFMVPEADLAAIWPRITKGTRVYIF